MEAYFVLLWISILTVVAENPWTGDGVVFEVPHQNYTLTFPNSHGGCLANITDQISGDDVLSAPLEVMDSQRSYCVPLNSLKVLHRNATSLSFSSQGSHGWGLLVDVQAIADGSMPVDITYTVVGGATSPTARLLVSTPSNAGGWDFSWLYTMDGRVVDQLGIAQHSEGVTCASNWNVVVSLVETQHDLRQRHRHPALQNGCNPGACCVVGHNDTSKPSSVANFTLHSCHRSPQFRVAFERLI